MKSGKKPTLTLDANLVQDDVPLQVLPNIFVGSIHCAFNLDALLERRITHVCCVDNLESLLVIIFPSIL